MRELSGHRLLVNVVVSLVIKVLELFHYIWILKFCILSLNTLFFSTFSMKRRYQLLSFFIKNQIDPGMVLGEKEE